MYDKICQILNYPILKLYKSMIQQILGTVINLTDEERHAGKRPDGNHTFLTCQSEVFCWCRFLCWNGREGW